MSTTNSAETSIQNAKFLTTYTATVYGLLALDGVDAAALYIATVASLRTETEVAL
jgi:hypothetical protein